MAGEQPSSSSGSGGGGGGGSEAPPVKMPQPHRCNARVEDFVQARLCLMPGRCLRWFPQPLGAWADARARSACPACARLGARCTQVGPLPLWVQASDQLLPLHPCSPS